MQEEGADLDTSPMSEDCLFLNIWTPGLGDGGARPVMVWFHGGGFTSGSGGSVRYDGTNLAAGHDVVLITVNHRLGAFGFLDAAAMGGDANSGNAGMLDIVKALEWVRDNAEAFGGDPGNVTVFGESGGGSKATTLMAMPAAEGLFDKVIAQSGLATDAVSPEAAAEASSALMDALGAEDLDDLRAAPMEDIAANMGGNWGPVSGDSLPRAGVDPSAEPASPGIPLMIGSNLTEATFFNAVPREEISDEEMRAYLTGDGPFAGFSEAGVDDLIAAYREMNPDLPNHEIVQRIATDVWMNGRVTGVAEMRTAAEAPTYVYRFAMRQGAQGGALNVPHTSEIAYVFDNLDLSTALVGEPDADDRELAGQMSAAWADFARNGDPNAEGLPDWPPYTADQKAVMVLDESPEVVLDPYSEPLAAVAQARTN